jgi:hypothetical protein
VGFNPLQAPNAPTSVTAEGGDTSATVSFTAPANVGGSAITSYTVQSTPDGVGASGASSPVTVSGLTNGTSYTFNVWALNSYGPSPSGGPSGAVTPSLQRGLFAGGFGSNTIMYVSISTAGNALDFGDLTRTGNWMAACSSATRGVFAGGGDNNRSNIMDYVTIATTGNATDFGDLAVPFGDTQNLGMGGASDATRGVFAGGNLGTADNTNVIQYITIATTGNSTNFGQLTTSRTWVSSCASSTRSIFAGGGSFASSPQNTIDFITTATTGNATDFGDLTLNSARMAVGVCSSSTRGLFAAVGSTYSSGALGIEFITMATAGNSTTFGNLITTTTKMGSTSSKTRGLFAGGEAPSSTNVIQSVTIATTGNAVDFGDLVSAAYDQAGLSNCHGGL